MKGMFKKTDMFLALALIALGIVSVFIAGAGNGGGEFADVTLDGERYGSYPLSEDASFDISTIYGSNTVTIEDGKVRVSSSDCPGHDCMNFGRISSPGQVIVCLPHHLVISISGESPVDAVLY